MKTYVGKGKSRFRLHVYPDIQKETLLNLYMLDQMVSYSISAKPDLVVSVGDLTEGNTATEWGRAKSEFDRLTAASRPWVVVPGNHDTDSSRITNMNALFSACPTVTGQYQAGHLENTYSIITLGGVQWLILCLEFGPRNAVVAWANGILSTYSTLPAILVTHAFLYRDGNRYNWAVYGNAQEYNPHAYNYTPAEGISDGEELWNSLIVTNNNVQLVLCGHDFDSRSGMAQAYRYSIRNSLQVIQVIRNFQEFNYGSGYLIEIDIDTVNKKFYLQTIDTVNQRPIVDGLAQFQLPWNL